MRWLGSRLVRALLASVALVVCAYSGAYLGFNDRTLGAFISARVNKVERGTFTLGFARFPYWGGLFSLLFDTPARVAGGEYTLRDPDGNLVLEVPRVETDVYLRELVVSLLKYAASGRFHLTLHFARAYVPDAVAVIAPTRSSLALPKSETNVVAAMSSKKKTPPSGGELRIWVEDIHVEHVRFALGYPESGWWAKIPDATVDAALIYSSRLELETPDGPFFFFQVKPIRAPRAELVLGGGEYRFPLDQLKALEFGPSPERRQDLRFRATARSLGADVAVRGVLTDAYGKTPGVQMALDFQRAAGLIGLLPRPVATWLGGEPRGQVRFHGPFSHVVIEGETEDATADVIGVKIAPLSTRLRLENGFLLLWPQGRAAGGRTAADIEVKLTSPGAYRARIDLEEVNPERWGLLPPSLRSELGGRLSGSVTLKGDLGPKAGPIFLTDLVADLERSRPGKLPKRLKLRGALDWGDRRVILRDVSAAGEGLKVAARGTVEPGSGRLDTQVSVESGSDAGWLGSLGLRGARLGAARLEGRVHGTLAQPAAEAHLAASELIVSGRRASHVDAELALAGGTISATSLKAQALSARLEGSGAIDLFGEGLSLKARPAVRLQLAGRGVSLAEASGWAGLGGRGDLQLEVAGPLDDPRGHLMLRLPALTIQGDPYRDGRLDLLLGEGGATVRALSLERVGGGKLSGSGRVGWDGSLGLDLHPHQFPLAAIPGISSLPVSLRGTLSGDVSLGGDLAQPEIGGLISLVGAKVRETFLGDGTLKLTPGADAIAISGSLFGKVTIDGYVTVFPKLTVAATVGFKDLELERIFPEMKKLAEVAGKASGTARVTFDGSSGLTYASLTLDSLVLTLTGTEDDGHARRLLVRNQEPVVLSTDGTEVKIERADLTSVLGAFSVRGRVSALASDVRFHGQIGLELFEYFFREVFEHTHGDAFVDLSLQGPLVRPRLDGWIDLRHARLQPRAVEAQLSVPVGRVEFTSDSVKLTNLALVMDGARAQATGLLTLDSWRPKDVFGNVRGELSMRLLAWLFRDYVSEAVGKVGVDVHVNGPWGDPQWSGTAELHEARVKLRAWAHDLTVKAGTVIFAKNALFLGCGDARPRGCRAIEGALDEQPLGLEGRVELRGGELGRVDVALSGTELRFATPEFAVSFSPRVRLRGDGRRLVAEGAIDLNEGRYKQNFDVRDLVLSAPRTAEKDTPFWTGKPLLEQAQLDLHVQSPGPLFVKNNIADLSVKATLAITGTLADPRLSGTIQVDPLGQFTIPLARIPFTSNAGQVTFDADKRLMEDTPSLNLGGSGTFLDQNDASHVIDLKILGTISSPRLLLSSPEGWDQNTILTVLVTGQLPQTALQLGQASNTVRQGESATSGVIRSATGTFIGQALGDPINKILGLDQTLIEIGSGSFDVKLCKRFGRSLKTCGLGEVGFGGASRVESRLELRMSEYTSTIGFVEYLTRGVGSAQDSLTRGRLELRLLVPLGY